jgi:uncharacterized MAPEG superfamily protein
MTPELTYLVYFGLWVITTLLAQVLAAMLQVGLPALAGNREGLVLTGMAFRLERAANNSLLALALIAPAVITLHLTKQSPELAAQAMLVFLLARIGYVVLYALGITWFRTLAWLTGFGCTALLYVKALGL